MTEHPIIFSGDSVRAILAGTKTQTRRLVKVDDGKVRLRGKSSAWLYLDFDGVPGLSWRPWGGAQTQPYPTPERACHLGIPGDRLWVRERWAHDGGGGANCDDPRCGIQGHVWYYATEGPETRDTFAGSAHWRPSIHMPRWASRLTLEVTEVRVQRLQDAGYFDLKAEGILPPAVCGGERDVLQRDYFREAWDGINGKRAPWASNAWVWAVSFRVQR